MKHLRKNPSRILGAILAAGLLAGAGGCGVLSARQVNFPNAERGVDGQTFTLDQLRDIATDNDLNEAEKREAFEDLGIEDQDLIDALLTLTAES
jgi:hypothetical protein